MVTNNTANISSQGVVYYNGTGSFSGLDGSTSGKVLTSNGTGAAPSFQDASAGTGSYIFIDSKSPSVAASAAFTSGIDNTYDTYMFLWKNVSSDTTNNSIIAEVSDDGGSTWKATGYNSTHCHFNGGGIGVANITTSVLLTVNGTFTTAQRSAGRIMFHYVRSAGTARVEGNDTDSGATGGLITSSCPASLTINAIRFRANSGNISGFFSMYGVKES